MITQLGIQEFLKLEYPIIDVRSQSEYMESHIIGALNIPLLNDENRVKVGKIYKSEGKESAIALGFKLVNPLKAQIFQQLKESTNSNAIRLYCARGGLRSSNMSKFFSDNNYNIYVLKGGYKAYKNHVLKSIATFNKIIILSAYTGSGKTEILRVLKNKNQQVLDLEEIASHKGSVFGGLGYGEQCSSGQFHNKIYEALKTYDSNQVTWVESESITIGSVHLPRELWENMKKANGIEYRIPNEFRVKHILEQYGGFDSENLSSCIQNLRKRIGNEACHELLELIQIRNLEAAVLKLLKYYDMSYEYGRNKRNSQNYVKIEFSNFNLEEMADNLLLKQHSILN